MKRFYLFIFLVIFPLVCTSTTITQTLCARSGYHCIMVLAGDSWESLWPSRIKRLAVQRVNRMNAPLLPGTTLAVPDNMTNIDSRSFSPLPLRINRQARRTVWIYLKLQAWGAYDYDGRLLHWGPLSSGSNFCAGTQKSCSSPTGDFNVRALSGAYCISERNPDGECGGDGQGTCIYYSTAVVRNSQVDHNTNYALLAAQDLPGFPSTTGCFHLIPEDFHWLYSHFIYMAGNLTDIGTSIKIRN